MQTAMLDQTHFKPLPESGLPIYSSSFGDHVLFYAPRLVCVVKNHDRQAFVDHTRYLTRELGLNEAALSIPLTGLRGAAMRMVSAGRSAVEETARGLM